MIEKTLAKICAEQEERYQFSCFSREDAIELGLKLYEAAQEKGAPVAIEITVNGLVVFRCFPEGTTADNGLWLARKRNAVELTGKSSLRFMAELEQSGETLAGRKLAENDYAACGGGFPILLRGTGMIGTICVSGLPHEDDHRLIVNTITEWRKQ